METILFLAILLMNLAFLYFSQKGVLLNIFAIFLNFITFMECSTWFEYIFITIFIVLQSIIVIGNLGE